ncbi:MAG: sporulation integral membrane protein YtvI [Firmicutes bacterium]|nr:sporulation integral membrane protein YtvI [Bacillota bacterium]
MPDWLRRLLYAAAGIAAVSLLVVLICIILRYALKALLPFIIAAVFALLMEPPVRLLSRRLPRGFAVLLTMVVFFALAGLTVTVLVAHLAAELGDLSRGLPEYVSELQRVMTALVTKIRDSYGALPPEAVEYLENAIADVAKSAGEAMRAVVSSFLGFLGSLPNAALVLIVSLVAAYFISRDRRVLGKFWARAVPAPWGDRMLAVGREAFGAFLAYLRAQFVLVVLTMFLSTVGLYILKVKYALTLGLVIGFFDVLPVLGPSAIFVPWIILAFITGAKAFSLRLLILYGVVFMIRQLFEARIVALSLGLHPLAVMVGMYAGLKLLGVTGLLLGPILVIIIQAAYKARLFSFKGKVF